MAVILALCRIAIKEVAGEQGEKVLGMLTDHFSDQSQRLAEALRQSNERAWKAFELALAGDSWWDRLKGAMARGEDKTLAAQVRSFLDAHPLQEFVSEPRVRELCLRDLHAARKAGHFTGDIDKAVLAEKLRSQQRLADPLARTRYDLDAITEVADFFQQQGFKHIAWLLNVQVGAGKSLLAVAVRYYFRRAVETDRELFQGLAFLQMEGLSETQARGFAELNEVLAQHGEWFEESLRLTQEAVEAAVAARQAAEAGQKAAEAGRGAAEAGRREAAAGRQEVQQLRKEFREQAAASAAAEKAAVLDLKSEMQSAIDRLGQQYEAQFQRVYAPLIKMLEQLQVQNRPVRPSDSMSIRTDRDRELINELLQKYRAIPTDQRRGRPALLNGMGQLEFAANDFEAAQRAFAEAAAMAPDDRSRAEAYYNMYRAALERRPTRYDDATAALLEAAALDAEHFAPFPLHDYELLNILGAGGFGVTFLCRHRWSRGEVAIKSLSAEGLDRDVRTVFQEAQALEQLHHPAIIRLRDCNFADKAHTRPYLIMDYFPGKTLEGLVAEKGPLKFDELVPLAILVADALQAAHGANLLHRDVKPANLLVRKEGSSWQTRVIDFGLALRADVLARSGSSASRRGHSIVGSSIAGTLDYAAPEQMGKLPGVPIGPRADIYGFAKMCCYAVFQTPEPTYLDWQKIPRPAAELLGRCLERLPERRPASFTEVRRHLEKLHVPEVLPTVRPAIPAARRPAEKSAAPPPLPKGAAPPKAEPPPRKAEAPPPLPARAEAKPFADIKPESVYLVQPVQPLTLARVRFFMPPASGLKSLVSQPQLKVYLNGRFIGEGWARGGFDLSFELQPGDHALEVACWQNGERGRKAFPLALPRVGCYSVRFNLVLPDLSSSLFGGTKDMLARCSVDMIAQPQ
jgi:hypothetical protein